MRCQILPTKSTFS